MKTALRIAMLACALIGVATLAGCVQSPTEKQTISDLRPSISFRALDSSARAARVEVDGLDMGRVGEYIEGEGALRILPGTHLLRVTSGARVLLEDKIYLGDGVNRSFIVK